MHIQQHHASFFANRELDELYISIALRSFAQSTITVFLPIYLLELGFSLSTVLFFFAVLTGTHALCAFPAAAVAARYGLKHAILISTPLLIAAYLLLYTIDFLPWPILIPAILFGMQNALFWVGYHSDFAMVSRTESRGATLGFARILMLVFQMLGPLAGGVLLSALGFPALFLLVSLLLFVSTIPLFFSDELRDPVSTSFRTVFQHHRWSDVLGLMGEGIDGIAGKVVWPIFIFLFILGTYTALGFVSSLMLLFSLLILLFTGLFSDARRTLTLRIGSVANALIWIARPFIATALGVYVVDALYGMGRTVSIIPFDAKSYEKATRRDSTIATIALREFLINGGATLFLVAVGFFPSFPFAFLLAGAAALLYFSF